MKKANVIQLNAAEKEVSIYIFSLRVAKLLGHEGQKTLQQTVQLHRNNLVKKPKAIFIFLWSTITSFDPPLPPHLELEIPGCDNCVRGGNLRLVPIEGPLS